MDKRKDGCKIKHRTYPSRTSSVIATDGRAAPSILMTIFESEYDIISLKKLGLSVISEAATLISAPWTGNCSRLEKLCIENR